MNQNNKNPNNKARFNKRDIAFVVLIAAVIIGIIIFFVSSRNQPTELNVNQFYQYVDAGQIDKMVASPTGSGANAKLYSISGELKNDAGKFVVVIDNTTYEYLLTKINNGTASYTLQVEELREVDWLTIIVSVGIPILLVVFLIVMLRNSAGSNNKAFDFARSRAKLNRQSSVTFDQVAGADEEKEEMKEIIDFLKYPKKYREIGARIPKGILLVGHPGTGKTLLAKAVAGEAKVPFYSISGSDFVEMFVGVGASRVRDMFKTAKQTAPCIVFIDEIDAVGRQRGAGLGGGNDEREQTLNQLLVEMDGFGENSSVIIMAATNRPDVLDPALLRPGRFDRQITMTMPDVNARTEILKVHARNKKLSPRVNLEDVSRRTPGFSGADLENLLNEAALLAARENRKEIKIYDIDEAIDRVIMGPAKKSRKYTDKEKRIISFHEAGHAVIGVKLDNAEIVQKVTIVPRGQAGGYAMMTPEEEHFIETKDQLIDEIVGLLGGRASEELMCGVVTTGAHNDLEKSTKIARAMVAEYGMSDLGLVQYEQRGGSVFLGRDYMTDKNFSNEIANEIDSQVRILVSACYEKAKKVLEENKELLTLVANHLYEIETLTKEDIYELVETGKLAWWEKKKAKAEAEKIAREKEAELQEIYEKQLKAMEEAKNASDVAPDANNTSEDVKEDNKEE